MEPESNNVLTRRQKELVSILVLSYTAFRNNPMLINEDSMAEFETLMAMLGFEKNEMVFH